MRSGATTDARSRPGGWRGETIPFNGQKAYRSRGMLVLLLVVLQLQGLILAFAHTWHAEFHPTASQPNHQCLATLLETGQLETTMTPLDVRLPLPPIPSPYPCVEVRPFLEGNPFLPLERAPPV